MTLLAGHHVIGVAFKKMLFNNTEIGLHFLEIKYYFAVFAQFAHQKLLLFSLLDISS